MKLWIIKPVDENVTVNKRDHEVKLWTWDCSYGFVVRAPSEHEARRLASLEAGFEGDEVWFDSNMTSCLPLTDEGEAGILLKDYLTG